MVMKSWQEVAKLAQECRDKSIAEVQPAIPDVPEELPLNVTALPRELLSEQEVAITETSPEGLLTSLATGKLTSIEVTNAFLRRAGLAQKLTNCVTELLPSDALERAKYLDDYFLEHRKPIGPLHGLPISVKEHIGIKGKGLNGGFVGWWDHVADEDAHIVRLLFKAGCVLYARTTQPQCLMHLETSNNLYGETVNPFNRKLTPGGSSGGEGALIGLRGSCLGIGTDIGGSIRSPSANCGIYGFRPTSHRLPMGGMTAPMAGEEQVVPVVGPMSTSLGGCKIFMKTLIDQKPWLTEPQLLPFPWRINSGTSYLTKIDGKKRLKVAVLWDDGVVKPHPPVIRALREVVDKLKCIPDVEVVDWKPYKHDLGWEIISTLYFCDGGKQDTAAIESSGEPWRPLSRFIIHEQPGVKEQTISEVWELTIKREEYRAAYAKLWNETALDDDPDTAVDVILCPVGPGAAPPLDNSKYWGYTSIWNILDYPAVVFPVTKVDTSQDAADTSYEPRNSQDEFNHKLYSPEVYLNAPVSLQLVGRRYDDEKVFEVTEFIQESIGLPFVAFP